MGHFFIPSEGDFKQWVREAVKECLDSFLPEVQHSPSPPYEEPLLTRKEIAGIFRISLVTLHDWMKRGLPCHKQRGRVYFLRSEVMEYVKRNRKHRFEKM